jgi:hypothetical protein
MPRGALAANGHARKGGELPGDACVTPNPSTEIRQLQPTAEFA